MAADHAGGWILPLFHSALPKALISYHMHCYVNTIAQQKSGDRSEASATVASSITL